MRKEKLEAMSAHCAERYSSAGFCASLRGISQRNMERMRMLSIGIDMKTHSLAIVLPQFQVSF